MKGQLLIAENTGSVLKNIMAIAVVAPFFLVGFDAIPQVAEEINVPFKKLGKLLGDSSVLAVAFYGLVVLAVGYGMNTVEITESASTSDLVTADAMSKQFNSAVMVMILIIGGIIMSLNSFLMGGCRAIFSLAESYMVSYTFAKVHPKYKPPVVALSIGLVFCGRGMLIWIANSASFAYCIAYCIVFFAFMRLRKTEPEMNRPFKVGNYRIVGLMVIVMSGLLCVLYLVPRSGSTLTLQELIISGGWASSGLIVAVACKIEYKDKFGR